VPVQGSDESQQIDVCRAWPLAGHSRHHPARAQKGQIERAAIECRHHSRRLDLPGQRVQERCLHAGLRQEDLRHAKTAVDRPGDGGGENVGPGSSGQAGRLGVDVSDRAGVRFERRKRDHVLTDQRPPMWRRHELEAARQLALEVGARPWRSP